ncbi:hypothetical protein [Aquibacillus kalidii]|uniref:hypothetical protein n=1 Tax=Aquibacillus kalidii TaxID=2762597 RepID=UPI0016469523|nr:hypothetical protein [Aquibacillus kalidii]
MTLLLEERITNHDTYTKIERIIQLSETFNSVPSEQVSKSERLSETFNILKEALDRADPLLISTTTLQNMNSHVTNILNELNSYNSNKNVQHLNNATTHLEKLIPFFSQVMVTRTPEDIEGVRNAVIAFRKSIGQHLANVEREANEAFSALDQNQNKLNELTSSIEGQKTRLDSIISDFQEKFLNGQAERNEKTEQLIEDTKSEINKYISDNSKSVSELIKKQREEHNNQINKNEIEYDEQMANQEKEYLKQFEKMEKMNKEAEKILGLMSMKGLAQGYQKIANSEGRKSLTWNVISILSLLGVLWFGYQYIILHEGEMTWTALISRVVLTGVGVTLFTYCAKQATNHRNEERRNRKIELELASLDPYLKDMEEPEQKKVKQSLVDKYFGVELQNTTDKQTQQTKNQQQSLVDSISNNPQILQALAEKLNQYITK